MEQISMNFKLEKYTRCLDLFKSLPETDDIVENLTQENNKLICESMVKIYRNNPDDILEIQEQLYVLWDKVTSVDMIVNCIPLQLKLTTTINFFIWLVLYNDFELNQEEIYCYIELVGNILNKGKGESQGKIPGVSEVLDCLYSFKNLLRNQHNKTVLLILELVTIVLIYIYKLKRTSTEKYVEIINLFTSELNEKNKLKETLNEFLGVENNCMCLFKFGFGKRATTISELDDGVIYYLYLLESALLFVSEDFHRSLKSLKRTCKFRDRTLFNYLGVLNCYELENWDLCLGFLYKGLESPMSVKLKARYHIMNGKLECIRRNHKEAIKCFEEALSLCPNLPISFYLLGQEYGRMGLIDFMVENFEKLVETLEDCKNEEYRSSNFESTILRIIHLSKEVSETEALYALSAAYALNERFHKAAETFDKLLKLLDIDKLAVTKTTPRLPNYLTILHEASVTNLLIGNLVRAEQLAIDAIERYTPQEQSKKPKLTQTNLNKDVKWLKKIIEQELIESDPEPKDLQEETRYTEEVFFIFQQNVIGLLIHSEIQRIQEVDEYKATLGKILSIFSCYLASMCKKKEVSKEENYVWTLVKALAGKTCLRIVAALSNSKDNSNIDKMYKRALSCNKGDKDALFGYFKFLGDCGKGKEALKLWRTFYKEESTISIDEVQSSALRYFLVSKVSKREIDKIQAEIEFSNTKYR